LLQLRDYTIKHGEMAVWIDEWKMQVHDPYEPVGAGTAFRSWAPGPSTAPTGSYGS
jgi:hypothetical protein